MSPNFTLYGTEMFNTIHTIRKEYLLKKMLILNKIYIYLWSVPTPFPLVNKIITSKVFIRLVPDGDSDGASWS